jgi:arylsulfatase A-like enzyme
MKKQAICSWLVTVLVATGVALAAPAAWAKNYLVIIGDEIGRDKVSSYAADVPGYAPSYLPDTQTIDSLAAAGVRFTRAWATPFCSPTRASFQTGLHPFRTGIGTALGDGAVGLDTSSPVMLAKTFGGGNPGYATGMFGKWHIGTADAGGNTGVPRDAAGNLRPTFSTVPAPALAGWSRFFGLYDGYPGTSAAEDTGYFQWIRVGWLGGGSGFTGVETTHSTERIEQQALSWINSRTQPWLAVVAFNAAHSGTTAATVWNYGDVDPPAGNPASATQFRTPALSCLAAKNCAQPTLQVFQGLVEDMDIKIEALLNGIPADVLDDTVIVFFGDNGTPGENNGTATAVQESIFNVGGRGKGTVYENGVGVPLIVADGQTWRTGAAGPTITAPGRIVAARVNTLDIYNTLVTDAFNFSLANVDSMPFNDCFTNNDIYCNFPGKRYGYTETFPSVISPVPAAPTPNGAQVTVSYGEDTMVAMYDAALACLAATYYDTSTDPLQTTPVTWPGIRSRRLRDYFTNLHAPVVSWAHASLAVPVVPFCP